MTPEQDYLLEEKVATALREECLLIFGTAWNRDNSYRLARRAIEAVRDFSQIPTGERA